MSIDKRLAMLERRVGESRLYILIEQLGGPLEWRGEMYADLDAFKAAHDATDNDTIVIVCLREGDKDNVY